jgi:1-acyl-sn-glycerol-3-phosphate acyltransferase
MKRDAIHGSLPCAGSGQFADSVSVVEHRVDHALRRTLDSTRPDFSVGRLWRTFGTGISFAVFGASALGLTLLVFPLCALAGGGAARRQARVQRSIHYAYRAFVKLMTGLGLIRTDWIGAEALRTPGPHLIVANHPTLIDIIQLISRLPQADCVIAAAHMQNPFLARAAAQAGYITNAQGAAVVDACVEKLRSGRTVVLFPEGTRSASIGMRSFRRGAAHIALRASVPLVPVVISCVPRMLRKGQPWWDVPESRSRYTITVLDPIEPQRTGATAAVVARHLTAKLREQIGERLDRADHR